jgi:hypothetical protein
MGSRDSPGERNPPIKVTFQGASSSGIPPQGASSSSKMKERVDLKLVSSNVVRLHLKKTVFLQCQEEAKKS